MKMAQSFVVLFSLISILCCQVSPAISSTSIQDTFLRCLHNSQVSNPISVAIYTPKNSSFLKVYHSYARNLRILSSGSPEPLAIVTAEDESHVQATVTCSKTLGILIKTRSGGHDFEGLSYASNVPFVIIDMFNLRSISVDLASETMWVQAGATLGEIYHRIAKESNLLGFPAGVCPTLGAGGHFSGAGYGNMMRKYGLSVDNIIDARIVNSEGKILDRESMGEGLFWAIRGGGGGSFGVILSWKLKLVAVPDTVTVFRVARLLNQSATDILYKWQHIATKLPEELFIRVQPQVLNVNGSQNGNSVTKTIQVTFIALYLGKIEKLLLLMNTNFLELGLTREDCVEMPWVNSTLFWYGFPKGTSIDVLLERNKDESFYFKYKSDYVRKPISKEGLELIWKKMIEFDEFFMEWNPYGGRMSQIGVSETPFPHRDALFKIAYILTWSEEGHNMTNHYVDLQRKFFDFMTPYVTKSPREAFLNYRDLDIGSSFYSNATYEEARVYGVKYFKCNFDKLVLVKTQVDPDNFFRNEQSIPPLPRYQYQASM